nr:EOG090X02VY [Sida crystallina]
MIDQIEEEYRRLSLEEDKVTEKLQLLLGQQCQIEAKLRNVTLLFPRLHTLKGDAKHLSEMINFTAELAENVSAKVRELDIAKGRVSECQQRVNDLLDLQLCREGVITAMKTEDFEQAAGHVHRFLAIDESTLKQTAGDVAQGSNVNSSLVLLHESKAQLCKVVSQKFDEAVLQKDAASVVRFFKIFPLLNMHNEGLKKFSLHLASQLKAKSKMKLQEALNRESNYERGSVIFADALIFLLEEVACIMDINQPLVETFYGPGRLIQVVEHLQQECDQQANIILNEFYRTRQLNQLISQISEYKDNRSQTTANKCDPRDLDTVLAELTLMSARTDIYLRFIQRRTKNDLDVGIIDEGKRKEKMNKLEALLSNSSGISQSIQVLLNKYVSLETYYLSESVLKAVAMDSIIDENLFNNCSHINFIFIMLFCRRSLSSCSLDHICAVINNTHTLLVDKYSKVFKQQLNQGFPSGYLDLAQAYSVFQISLQQGRLQSSDTEKAKAKANFLTTLNNIEASIELVESLDEKLSNDIKVILGSPLSERDSGKLHSCLSELKSTTTEFRNLLNFGHEQLESSAIKPRIKPWVDHFLSVNHDIGEDEFGCYEAQDPFVQELIVHLDGFMSGFKHSLTPKNYETLVVTLASRVALQLEKAILKTSFSRLGAMQLDKEVRMLVAYLSAATTWTIRDRFTRLTQIVTLLNLEKLSELSEYWGPNAGSITWRLKSSEVQQVLSLRTDFRGEELRRLKL